MLSYRQSGLHSSHRIGIAVFALAAFLLFAAAPALADREGEPQSSAWKIVGTVRDALGFPVSGASVRIETSAGSKSQEASTDTTGNFLLQVPDSGSYVLRIEKPGYVDCVERVEISDKKRGSVDVVLLRPEEQATKTKSASEMQFSDKPDFTVAGVTDSTAAGGHGSDVNLRTSEALAKQARALDRPGGESSQPVLKPDSEALRRRRDQIWASLARGEHADLHRELGDIEEELNDSLAAEHEYERATQMDPSEQNYFAWGTELLLHRAIQPAVQVFSKAVEAYPQSERMLAGLGAALHASGLYAQAAQRLCEASDLRPTDATPYFFLGKMVQASQQPLPCAEEKLARFSHDRPDSAPANYYYALALWKQSGNSNSRSVQTQVESLLKNSILADAKFAEAHLQLGIVYSAQGGDQKGLSEYENAVNADPNLAEAHFRLAQAYKKAGETTKAQREFQAYERVQKSEAAAVEQQRREVQQFIVVFKDQPQSSPARP